MARGKANGNGFSNHANGNQLISRTITGLKRWSIINKDLPGRRFVFTWANFLNFFTNSLHTTAVSQVRAIHVYDFDNTRESSR